MTSNPDTMLAGKIAIEALRLMEDGRYRYLPIVDERQGRRDRFTV
jgi:hypothetical protein